MGTFELDVQAAELQLHALQSLSQRFVVVTDGLLGARAEGQREVLVGLLPVVVRPHRVHPQDHLLLIRVLSTTHNR